MSRPRNGTVDQLLDRANAEQHFYIRHEQLPLCCPMPDQYLWNAHPKVYLPFDANGEAKCPYCGTRYTLVDAAS